MTEFHCSLSSVTVAALETLALEPWTSVALATPVKRSGAPLGVQTSEMRVAGLQSVSIRAESVDVAPKFEVFRLHARVVGTPVDDPRFKRQEFLDAGELVSAFLGNQHRLFVAGRKVEVPSWASTTVDVLIVEDLLIVRDYSGQQAFVAASDRQPTTLFIARRWEDVPNRDAAIVYLRAL